MEANAEDNMDTLSKENKGRKLYIEILRIIAILFVLFNHTNNNGFFLFEKYEPNTFAFWVNLANSIFCSFNSCLFFMVSGALLLNKEEDLTTIYKKRVLKYFCILICTSLVFMVSRSILLGKNYTILIFIRELYSKGVEYHLWFLYAYIAFLMLLPVSRCIARNMDNKLFVYIIILHVFFRILPVIEYILWKSQVTLKSTIIATLPLNTIFFPCVGYYLDHRVNIDHIGKKLILMWGGVMVLLGLCCYATYLRGMDMGRFGEDVSQMFHSNINFLISMCIYLSLRYLSFVFKKRGYKVNKHLEQFIISISGCTFGIYLIHPMLKETGVFKRLLDILTGSSIPSLVSIWIYICIIYFVSYLVVLSIKKAGSLL